MCLCEGVAKEVCVNVLTYIDHAEQLLFDVGILGLRIHQALGQRL